METPDGGRPTDGAMDSELVMRARRGDMAAFAAIAESAYPRLRLVAYRILRDPDMAEDATQQALVRIWRKLPRLKEPACFDAWSYRFRVRACADEARRRNRALPEIRVRVEPLAPDRTATIDDRDALERAFRCLSTDQRAVIVLRDYLELSLEDAAEVLGVPVGTVDSRLSRAMGRLRSALEVPATPLPARPLEATR